MATSSSPERKHRKSVAFANDETLIQRDGTTTTAASNGADKPETALHHTASNDNAVDDATAAFDDLALAKKKKKSKKVKEGDEAASTEKEKDETTTTGTNGETNGDVDAELDLTAMKKKKKSKKPKPADGEDFDSKLAAATSSEDPTSKSTTTTTSSTEIPAEEAGDMDAGTGIWSHSSTTPLPYPLLLTRFFAMLNAHNPDLLSSSSKSTKIPPPQCLREGNKKTIFANIFEISKKMNRSDEHVAQFLFAELGTTGSVAADRRLVIRGKFMGKQIENVLLRYIKEYVQCKTCKAGPTDLVRGENRLFFIECQQCNSRRSVSNIKSGFRGQVGKRKRQQK